ELLSSHSLSCALIAPPPSSTLFPYTTLFRSKYQVDEDQAVEVLKVENSRVRAEQIEKLRRLRAERDQDAVDRALAELTRAAAARSEEHTSELQSRENLVCRLLLEKKKNEQA